MNHPERFVQGYTVMTSQYRYTEYVGLTDAETEEQQPNWGDVHDWGELYDLEADPQENFNLYRDHDYLQLKVQMRKLLHDWGELYDLEADPHENFNLYRDHDYLQLKVQM